MSNEIALALSGGGVRGMAHIGAIRAIEEAGYRIRALSGCSFGAIVAVTYAAGIDWQALPHLSPAWLTVRNARPGWGQGGLLSTEMVAGLLKSLSLPTMLEDLPLPVTVNATDLASGEAVYFTQGLISMLVSASCCLPGLMTPVQYDGRVLIDGGVVDVLPIEPLKGLGLPIWAIHTNPYPENPLPGISARLVVERSGQLMLSRQAQAKRDQVDRYLEPKSLGNYRMLDWARSEQIAEEGYAALQAELKS